MPLTLAGILRLCGGAASLRHHFAQDDNFMRETVVSDQAGTDAAEEVFGVGFGLGLDFGLIAVFEGYLLQK